MLSLYGPLADLYRLAEDTGDDAIPLPTADDERAMHEEQVPESLPILTLRNTILFPGVVMPITVGRDAALKLVKDAYAGDRLIGVVAQRDPDVDEPGPDDLYRHGTVASILKLIKMPDGSKSIVIQGKRRFEVQEFVQTEPYFQARVTGLDRAVRRRRGGARPHALAQGARRPDRPPLAAPALRGRARHREHREPELPHPLHRVQPPGRRRRTSSRSSVASLPPSAPTSCSTTCAARSRCSSFPRRSASKVKTDVDKQQREFLLRQQLKAIQDELGEGEGGGADIAELRERAAAKTLPAHARKTLDKELDKLAPPQPDGARPRRHPQLRRLASRPALERRSPTTTSTSHEAERMLDEDHYGLEKVKQRILEYLAVLKLKGDMKAPILCLYGPPGVGKTSLGKSVGAGASAASSCA